MDCTLALENIVADWDAIAAALWPGNDCNAGTAIPGNHP